MSDETGQAIAGMDHRLADFDGHDTGLIVATLALATVLNSRA
jgi:hypothetical protein